MRRQQAQKARKQARGIGTVGLPRPAAPRRAARGRQARLPMGTCAASAPLRLLNNCALLIR